MKRTLLLMTFVVAGAAGWKSHPAALPAQQAEIAVGEIGSHLPDFR